jgi:hypothetical protein
MRHITLRGTISPSLFHPLSTINLHIALKAQHENALIEALYGVNSPGHPSGVLSISLPHAAPTHVYRCPVADMALQAQQPVPQVAGLVAPHPDVLELFNNWLNSHVVFPSTISTKHGGS